MLTTVLRHVDKAKYVVRINSPAILTGLGISGTVVTAYLTGRASFRAAEIIESEKRHIRARVRVEDLTHPNHPRANIETEEEANRRIETTMTRSAKVKLVWRLYLPPTAVCLTTIGCIFAGNRISSTRVAALTTAAGVSERAFKEYKEKVIEKLGDRQDQKIRDEVAQDRVNNHPLGSREVILAGTGEVLCYDMITGRYFQSSVEEIKKAENSMNWELLNHSMSVSLSEFHDELGLPPTSYTESVGWNPTHKIKVLFSTVMSSD